MKLHVELRRASRCPLVEKGWRLLLLALLWLGPLPCLRAQNAAPKDRNPVNTTTRPGGMSADSPVTFPQEGALPAKFPPDVKEESWPVEKEYYLFSSPCRSLAQIRKIQAEMPDGKFAPPVNDWKNLTRTRRLLNEAGGQILAKIFMRFWKGATQ